jgi:hypothetical protein
MMPCASSRFSCPIFSVRRKTNITFPPRSRKNPSPDHSNGFAFVRDVLAQYYVGRHLLVWTKARLKFSLGKENLREQLVLP